VGGGITACIAGWESNTRVEQQLVLGACLACRRSCMRVRVRGGCGLPLSEYVGGVDVRGWRMSGSACVHQACVQARWHNGWLHGWRPWDMQCAPEMSFDALVLSTASLNRVCKLSPAGADILVTGTPSSSSSSLMSTCIHTMMATNVSQCTETEDDKACDQPDPGTSG
jgi:hypothetical protein